MREYFIPKMIIKCYNDLSIQELKRKGIRCLICDVDNTLIAYDEITFSDDARYFVDALKASKIELILISNNVHERIEPLAKILDVKAYAFAKKPLKKTYRTILLETGYHCSEVACLGDQLFTDILGANRMNLMSIYTYPLVNRDVIFTKINRSIEMKILKFIEKRKLDD